MKISKIKRIYEKLPPFCKIPFSHLIRGKLIHNKDFKRQYDRLEKFDERTEAETEDEQIRLLKETLIHAYEHTAYYHDLFEKIGFSPYQFRKMSELGQLPLLTKDIIKASFQELAADDIDNFYTVTTGGTTGVPLSVLMENKAIYKEWAFVYHYWAQYGYDFRTSKLATFRGVDIGTKLYEVNPLYREIRMNPFRLNHDTFAIYMKKIDSYGADFLYGYPSAIFSFCKLARAERHLLRGRFKAVFLISENLYPFQEELINEILGCPIGIFYGHSERAVFAERFDKGYRFNFLYGVTEIGKKNEPIVTGFINRKMPLIRYVVDDTVTEVRDDIYGGITKITGWYQITGHHDKEVLYGENGEEVSVAAINFHDELFQNIRGYQLLQSIPGEFILCLLPEEALEEDEIAGIKKRVEGKLGPAFRCKVEVVQELKLTERGKYKMLISDVGESVY